MLAGLGEGGSAIGFGGRTYRDNSIDGSRIARFVIAGITVSHCGDDDDATVQWRLISNSSVRSWFSTQAEIRQSGTLIGRTPDRPVISRPVVGPESLLGHDLRDSTDSTDSDLVVVQGGDDPDHVGAVPLHILDGTGGEVLCRGHDRFQIGMIGIDTRINDRDGNVGGFTEILRVVPPGRVDRAGPTDGSRAGRAACSTSFEHGSLSPRHAGWPAWRPKLEGQCVLLRR